MKVRATYKRRSRDALAHLSAVLEFWVRIGAINDNVAETLSELTCPQQWLENRHMRNSGKIRSIVLLTIVASAGCGGDAPKPARSQYIVDSQSVDSATGALTVNISVPPNATRDLVKLSVQEVVDSRKQEYRVISVKTYIRKSDENVPYASSYYDSSGLVHTFFGGNEEQKIPTH
ncbi:MAG TPA: hypothetical protein VFV34_16490 [Blastocatellia bacterium]|nr:hypothetical protein [Blastocatellia bacterium]